MKNKKIIIIPVVIILVLILGVIGLNYYFDNVYYKDNSKVLESISYEVPKEFEKISDYGNSRLYYYYKDSVGCSFSIFGDDDTIEEYKDGKEYLESSVYTNQKDKVSEIEEKNINDYKWHYMSVEKDSGISHYYATVREGVIYYLKYDTEDYLNGDGTSDYCLKQHDVILNTVKFK